MGQAVRRARKLKFEAVASQFASCACHTSLMSFPSAAGDSNMLAKVHACLAELQDARWTQGNDSLIMLAREKQSGSRLMRCRS